MKIAICYYSGAGNTAYIAEKIARTFEGKRHQTTSLRITAQGISAIEGDFDLLGVGFPIHFREAPRLVYQLLESLDGRGRPIFFFATKGLYSGNALSNIACFSAGRNFNYTGSLELFMPGTDFLILFARQDSLTERLLKHIHSRNISKKIDGFTQRVLAALTAEAPARKWYSLLDDHLVKKLETKYDDCHRDYIGRFHADPATCIECLSCVRGCPRGNIRLDGSVKFGTDCDVCLGCIHNCPTESIQIGGITQGNTRYKKVELL